MTRPTSTRPQIQSQPGNHEWFDSYDGNDTADFLAYRSRYHMPNAGPTASDLYYSFDVGLVHVVMVAGYCPAMTSTRTQPCLAPDSAQLAWLISDLAAVNRALTPWIVVAFHEPFSES